MIHYRASLPFKKRRFAPIARVSSLSDNSAASYPTEEQQAAMVLASVGSGFKHQDFNTDRESPSLSVASGYDEAEAHSGSGCLGKTPRGTYCCQFPLYQGSDYCRQHYREQRMSSKESESSTAIQDKRFIGAPGQVRCIATTTRRRPCAYVSVNGTPYCLLHANYDSVSAQKRSSDKSPRRANLAEKHAKSPYHLLSMLSTDQWYGQQVRILVGPMEGKDGTVEKWGNGWITVKTSSGPHNRRSFELRLLKTDGLEPPTSSGSFSSEFRATSPAFSEVSTNTHRESRLSIQTPTNHIESKEVAFHNTRTTPGEGKAAWFDRTATVTPSTPGKVKTIHPVVEGLDILDGESSNQLSVPIKKRKTL